MLRKLPASCSPERSLQGAFVLITLLLLGLAWLGWAYGHSRLTALRVAIDQRANLMAKQEQMAAECQSLDAQCKAVQAECDEMIVKLPDDPAESEFLTLLSQAADRFDVSLGDYRPGSVHTREHAKEIELRLRASGSYIGLCQWLDEMDNLPRVHSIQHVTLAGPAVSGGDCTVDVQLMLAFGFSGNEPGPATTGLEQAN